MSSFENWIKLYRSTSPDVRRRAAIGILEHSDDAPLELLINILTSMANQGLGAKAEKALLKRKDSDLVPKMFGLLDSNDQFVRECACKILGHSGDFSATPHLLRMLDDPKLMVRRAAGFALAFLKDPSSVSEIREQLKRHENDDFNVVSAIQCALQSLGVEILLLNEELSIKPDPNDPIAIYMACVHERLAEQRDGSLQQESVDRALEILFLPSFHPETLIQVSFDGLQTLLRMATMTSSVWNYEYALRFKQTNLTSTSHLPPNLIDEVCHIDKSVTSRFWNSIDVLVAAGVKSTDISGCDGISVRAFHRQNDSKLAFEAWSPERASPQGLFVGEVFDLAWNSITDKTMTQRLEQLYGYLRDDLPVRRIEGEILTLRVFGRLTSNDDDGLRSLFASLPKDEPLVLDMTNFEGMGTILYPTIREFALHNDKLAWACSSQATQHLRQIGIDSRSIFEEVEQAVEYLR